MGVSADLNSKSGIDDLGAFSLLINKASGNGMTAYYSLYSKILNAFTQAVAANVIADHFRISDGYQSPLLWSKYSESERLFKSLATNSIFTSIVRRYFTSFPRQEHDDAESRYTHLPFAVRVLNLTKERVWQEVGGKNWITTFLKNPKNIAPDPDEQLQLNSNSPNICVNGRNEDFNRLATNLFNIEWTNTINELVLEIVSSFEFVEGPGSSFRDEEFVELLVNLNQGQDERYYPGVSIQFARFKHFLKESLNTTSSCRVFVGQSMVTVNVLEEIVYTAYSFDFAAVALLELGLNLVRELYNRRGGDSWD